MERCAADGSPFDLSTREANASEAGGRLKRGRVYPGNRKRQGETRPILSRRFGAELGLAADDGGPTDGRSPMAKQEPLPH